jgi:hypothetical protein
MLPDDIDPTEPPPKPPSEVGSIKKTQESLRDRGYTLTALGPYRVSFFRTAIERDRYGLVPEKDWVHLTPKGLTKFLKDTPPLENPPRPRLVDDEPQKLSKSPKPTEVRRRRRARPD